MSNLPQKVQPNPSFPISDTYIDTIRAFMAETAITFFFYGIYMTLFIAAVSSLL